MDGRSLDAVISRMPLKERLLYHVMPSSSKKRLQKHSEGRQNRATRGTQTGTELLEVSDHKSFYQTFQNATRRKIVTFSRDKEDVLFSLDITLFLASFKEV